jgi:predicted PhzF superfamily epimerase YddE/YHI9
MRRFSQVDVFGAEPLLGNPVAVIHDAEGLSDAQMQTIARWTNLSETTFLLPPTQPAADYRVRIFTPDEELPFAGHPTLGTCHAWREATGSSAEVVVQECAAGLVHLRSREGLLAFAAPPLIRSGALDAAELGHVASALNLEPTQIEDAAWVDNGPGWVAVRLADAEAVADVRPGALDGYFIGVVGMGPDGLEVRAFFTANGVTTEDPVTGSLNASIAGWLVATGVLEYPYVARQGRMLGRDGRVHLSADADGTVWVAGNTVTVVAGEMIVTAGTRSTA